jgi:hypothetical protein
MCFLLPLLRGSSLISMTFRPPPDRVWNHLRNKERARQREERQTVETVTKPKEFRNKFIVAEIHQEEERNSKEDKFDTQMYLERSISV